VQVNVTAANKTMHADNDVSIQNSRGSETNHQHSHNIPPQKMPKTKKSIKTSRQSNLLHKNTLIMTPISSNLHRWFSRKVPFSMSFASHSHQYPPVGSDPDPPNQIQFSQGRTSFQKMPPANETLAGPWCFIVKVGARSEFSVVVMKDTKTA
jgi:hypothetical protein